MTPSPVPIDRLEFLGAMSTVANSVTVVTTKGEGGHHGATVSSFCSVSADPPSVLVCLHADTLIADKVLANQSFSVTVLPEGAQFLAERFAGMHDGEVENRFEGIECWETGAPALENATIFHCHLSQTVRADSHWVFIGQVSKIYNGSAKPLIYLDRKFTGVTRSKE